MKTILATLTFLVGTFSAAVAQLTIPSDGSDGVFNPTANVEIDLSRAVTGTWGDSNTANAGNGIYDAVKWAVVFKYASVNIPEGVTVTFANHPTHAPVVWLVQGTVTIAGTVNVNGKSGFLNGGSAALVPTEPGPGGFRGGPGGPSGRGYGLGIGGALNYPQYAANYGNPQILPLIGGSGSGAYNTSSSGAGGGGAILVVSSGTIQLSGSITATGGTLAGAGSEWFGSGGAIKLIGNQVTGAGTVNAGTTGRVRIETNSLAASIITTPSTIAVPPGTTPTIFQAATSPTVKIISVDGVPSPADPTAPLISSADIAIQKNTPVIIVLETRNFATAGAVVSVRIGNKYGNPTSVNATLDAGGTTMVSTWRVSTTLAPGFVTLQARATGP